MRWGKKFAAVHIRCSESWSRESPGDGGEMKVDALPLDYPASHDNDRAGEAQPRSQALHIVCVFLHILNILGYNPLPRRSLALILAES